MSEASGLQIEIATEADLDALAPLFDAYRRFYSQAGDVNAARAFLRARMVLGQSAVYLVRLDGAPAGFAQLYPTFSSVAMQPVVVLNDLFVAETARGRGVGRALTLRAIDHAREAGAVRLDLMTEVTNAPAQGLYESLGFVRNTTHYRYKFTL